MVVKLVAFFLVLFAAGGQVEASNEEEKVQYHEVAPGDHRPLAKAKREAKDEGDCSCLAEVYDAPNYRGRVIKIVQQNAEFNNDFFNDRVESIHVNGNCRWLFYRDHHFHSTSHLLAAGYYSSAPSWGGSGNQISSARVLPPNGAVAICLFQHSNYRGRMVVLYGSSNHLPSLDFGDHISSVIVVGGTWTLYQHSDYQGRSSRLSQGDYPTIHHYHVGGDSVSSVRKE